jgi:hypothetical protein
MLLNKQEKGLRKTCTGATPILRGKQRPHGVGSSASWVIRTGGVPVRTSLTGLLVVAGECAVAAAVEVQAALASAIGLCRRRMAAARCRKGARFCDL